MEDLDLLQQELEKLLSTCAVRNRLLRSEIESIDRVEERREERGKPPLKRQKHEHEKTKRKESKQNSVRVLKAKHYGVPLNNSINDLPAKVEVPKVLPRSDTSDKFWLSIEPYCAEVSKQDVAVSIISTLLHHNLSFQFLDDLIQECSQEVDVKIPEVGDHYASEWCDKILSEEQSVENGMKPGKSKTFSVDGKKNGLSAAVDFITSPSIQCLTACKEEKVSTKLPEVNEKLKRIVNVAMFLVLFISMNYFSFGPKVS